MKTQYIVFILFMLIFFIILTVFYTVYQSSQKQGQIKNPNKKRAVFFLVILSVVLIVMGITIPKSPYFLFSTEKPDDVIFVVAKQFSFALSRTPVNTQEDFGKAAGEQIKIQKGKIVEFRVTSWDVNHGFGIYKNGTLLAQVQIMPNYVNRLRWKFDEAGDYNIICLEYCGQSHSGMFAAFKVE